jgi:hypothetical protein
MGSGPISHIRAFGLGLTYEDSLQSVFESDCQFVFHAFRLKRCGSKSKGLHDSRRKAGPGPS